MSYIVIIVIYVLIESCTELCPNVMPEFSEYIFIPNGVCPNVFRNCRPIRVKSVNGSGNSEFCSKIRSQTVKNTLFCVEIQKYAPKLPIWNNDAPKAKIILLKT